MAGLLDFFDNGDAQLGLGLLAAAAPRADGAGFGQRLMEGVQYGQQWKKDQAKQKLIDMQMQEAEMKLGEQKRQAELQKWLTANAPKYFTPSAPAQDAKFESVPVTPQAATSIANPMALDPAQTRQMPNVQRMVSPAVPATNAAFDLNGFANAYAQQDPLAAIQLLQKDTSPLTVKEGETLLDRRTLKPIFTAAPKPEKLNPNQPFMVVDGNIVPNKAFQEYELDKTSRGAPRVSVDTRDPTAVAKAAMSFQNDYRAATKDSYQRAQAYESMVAASKDPSPKGDLTMVYSFIKALDPTSVVREGEISLVNANRNIPDQIKGYAMRISKGESLLPHERQDLINQARTLATTDYQRSRKDIAAYRDNAKRLQLDPDLYAPDPYANFKPNAPEKIVKRTGVANGKKVVEYTDGSIEYAN